MYAAVEAADGADIKQMPRPQKSGELLVWVIEGDDHEVEAVEATSEDEDMDAAAALFVDRDGEEGGDDEDDE